MRGQYWTAGADGNISSVSPPVFYPDNVPAQRSAPSVSSVNLWAVRLHMMYFIGSAIADF